MQNVKSTMIDKLLENIAPHYCYVCGQIGGLLCSNCKYDITHESFADCIACGRPAGANGICKQCKVPYTRAWCAAERSGAVERLINAYKFEYTYAAHYPLAELLLDQLSLLPADTIIVPIPTIQAHIRQRGYDHTLVLAAYVARKRQLTLQPILKRANNATQRNSNRTKRIAQAKQAFQADSAKVVTDRPYLIIDDVVTTGATMHYAALALRQAGAREVWVATIARQPLD